MLRDNGVESTIKKHDSAASKLGKTFGAIGKTAAVAGTAIVAGMGAGLAIGYKLAESASNLAEAQNVVETTFKKSGKAIEAWAKTTAKTAGISETASTQYVGFMGAMLKSSGVSEKASEGMSEKLVQLTGDMSSFYNVDTKDMWEKLRSGISGETEPLKQLGINMSVANLTSYALAEGIKKPFKEMTQGEQTTLRYNYLMKITKDAQGDFGKTLSTSFANQVRVAKLNIETLGQSVGTKLLPTFNKMVMWLNDNMPLIQSIVGKAMDFISKAFAIVVDVIKNNIMPALIDFWKWIQPNIPAISNIIKSAFDIICKALKVVGDFIANTLIPAFVSFWNWIQPYMPQIKQAVKVAFDVIKATFKGVGDFIVNVVIPIYKTMAEWFFNNFPKIKDAVMKAYNYIKPSFDRLVQTVKTDLMPIIIGLWDTVKKAMPGIKAIFEIVFPIIVQLVKNIIDDVNTFIQVVKGIYDFIKPGLDLVADIFSTVFGGIRDIIKGVQDVLNIFNRTPMANKSSTVTTNYKTTGTGASGVFDTSGLEKKALGDNNWRGGPVITQEAGGEILDLPSGTRIIPHDVSMEMAKNSAKNNNNNTSKQPITIQLVLQNGKAISEFIIDDLNNLLGNKNKVRARGVGI